MSGATFDDLPYLRPAIQTDAGPLQGALKRFILTNDKNTDAIGIQVFPNLEHKTIREWYAGQNLGGNLQPLKAAGYDALGDNNNIYVDALNFVTSTAGGVYAEHLYTNVYLFSINADARPETRQVFEQLMKNLQFSINLTNKKYCSGISELSCQIDFDCPSGQTCLADIDRMKRNVQRLRGLQSIKSRLTAYNEAEHPTNYPDLKEGTFLPGQSISAGWPSWGAALSNAVGSGLPVDPINRLGSAGTCAIPTPAGANTYCLNDRYCLGFAPTSTCNMHDPQTGWSVYERRFSFACATSSYAYRYIYSSDSNDYTVRARMETTEAISQQSWQNFANDFIDSDHFKLFEQNGICNAGEVEISTIATGGTCGDRVVQVGREQCDPPGSEKFGACVNNSMEVQVCGTDPVSNAPCQWIASTTPSGNSRVSCSYNNKCGDGKLDPGEECDLGSVLNGKIGSVCNNTCRSVVNRCGNGIVNQDEPKELCDWKKDFNAFSLQDGKCVNSFGINRACRDDKGCKVCQNNTNLFCNSVSDCPRLSTGECSITGLDCSIKQPCAPIKKCLVGKDYGQDCKLDSDCGLSDEIVPKPIKCVDVANDCGYIDRCVQVANSCRLSSLYKRNSPLTIIDDNLGVRYGLAKSDSCAWDCQNYGPYCGDGRVQNEFGEECDVASENTCSIIGVPGVGRCGANCKYNNSDSPYWWKFEVLQTTGNRKYALNNSTYFSTHRLPPGRYDSLACSGLGCPAETNEGKIGKALAFDGVDDFLSLQGTGDVRLLASNNFTIGAWIWPESVERADQVWTVVSKGNGSHGSRENYNLYFQNLNATDQRVGFAVSGVLHAVKVPGFNRWIHVVGTYDGQKINLYINGDRVVVNGVVGEVFDVSNTDPLYIGADHYDIGGDEREGSYFKGKIDEVVYYNRALHPEEIKFEYEHGWFCSTTVSLAGAQQTAYQDQTDCGNSTIDEDEACDRGVSNGVVCTASYNRACTYCAADCKNVIEVRPAEYCGDGRIQADKGELCEIDPNNNNLFWSAVQGGLASNDVLAFNADRNGWPVLDCSAAGANLPSAYLKGARNCVNNCTGLQDSCVKCGYLLADDHDFEDYVTVQGGRVINILDPHSLTPFPNGNLKLFPTRLNAMNGDKLLGHSQGVSFTAVYTLRDPLTVGSAGGSPATLIANPICSAGGDDSYKLRVNDDANHLFDFPVSSVPSLGQYDLALSPVMNSRNAQQRNHIRVVAVWYGKAGMGMDMTDSSGFVVNAPNNQRTVFESAYFHPMKVTGLNYFTASSTPSHGIWYHEESEIGSTFTESFTIDTNQMNAENYAFYVRTRAPINNSDGYLRVQVYFPENDSNSNHMATSTTYFLRQARASENDEATYWHVFNIRQASADLSDIRDRFVKINAKRTSPQNFDFSL